MYTLPSHLQTTPLIRSLKLHVTNVDSKEKGKQNTCECHYGKECLHVCMYLRICMYIYIILYTYIVVS